jgi:hypothetical protein
MKSLKVYLTKIFSVLAVMVFSAGTGKLYSQEYRGIAVLPIDTKIEGYSSSDLAMLIQLEMAKSEIEGLIDLIEVDELLNEAGISKDSCFSRKCLTLAGRAMKAEQILTGSVFELGNRMIFNLRVLDVESGEFVLSDVMEYAHMPTEIQRMCRISVQRLFNRTVDQFLLDQLSKIESPVIADQNILELDGPRFGVTYTSGQNGQRMQAPESDGGYDMFPVNFTLGYQKEWRYQSVGDFQALIEFIPMVAGLESGYIIPSVSFLNGFRWGKSGLEIGFGPTLRLVREQRGFYDGNGQWKRESEWNDYAHGFYMENPYDVVSRLDSRGELRGSVSLLFAAGKTFKSGYLNVPVNFFFSPRRDGHIYGFSCGFNVNRSN